MDLLIDIVVLNLFVEFTDTIVIDSFYISVLTAILLRLLLAVTLRLEHRVTVYFETKTYRAARALGGLCKLLILFMSKFVIACRINDIQPGSYHRNTGCGTT